MAAVLLGLSACAFPSLAPAQRTPVRWIMVEKPAGEVVSGGQNGVGRVDPQAVVLTMQPLYREDLEWEVVVDPHDYFVEVLEISPRAQVVPGETVTAKVRVGRARPNELYRLTARASQAGVEILGEGSCLVGGSSPANFRITSLSPGRAGIAVGLDELEEEER
jgi:hypothetical protein